MKPTVTVYGYPAQSAIELDPETVERRLRAALLVAGFTDNNGMSLRSPDGDYDLNVQVEAIEAPLVPKQIGSGDRTALIIVDVQNDFLPGGALAVPDSESVIAPIFELASVGLLDGRIDLVVASEDAHPANHVSFVENGGEWPTHCVANTHGARLHQEIERLSPMIVTKGFEADKESYSAFDGLVQINEEGSLSFLGDVLRSLGITHVMVAGLATDYCVKATAEAAREQGFEVTLFTGGCAGIDPDASMAVLDDFPLYDLEENYDQEED